MKTFIKNTVSAFTALMIFVLLILIIFILFGSQKSRIEKHSYLIVDVHGEVLEFAPPGGLMSQFFGGGLTLQDILDNMSKAALDKRLDGVILRLSANHTAGHAKMEEMRGAVRKVQAAGKKVFAYTDVMNSSTYYLAAVCDRIFMPDRGSFDFRGFALASIHIKKAMEKLGIDMNIHRIKDYKSAAEMVIRENMSEEARENEVWLLDDYWDMYVKALEEERGLPEARIIELMEKALFMPEDARIAGLVDELLYWDELEKKLMPEGKKRLPVVSMERYAKEKMSRFSLTGKKTIAVVHAQGMIAGRQSGVNPVLGVTMGYKTVNADLRRVRLDDSAAAVIFRVDSGGGDGLASDLIGREIEALAGVKPVVVSMVDVAASGGYSISYRASRIVADPLTITGSIGSISGKPNLRGLYDKLGVTKDYVTKGPNALFYSDMRNFTDKEREIFTENHWAGFNLWLRDVAEHRGMSFEEAENLAHGRVWTGTQARKNGLIDELGGLDRAVEIAKELAGIPREEQVTLVHYPKKTGLLGAVFGGGKNCLESGIRWAVHQQLHKELREAYELLELRPQIWTGEIR